MLLLPSSDAHKEPPPWQILTHSEHCCTILRPVRTLVTSPIIALSPLTPPYLPSCVLTLHSCGMFRAQQRPARSLEAIRVPFAAPFFGLRQRMPRSSFPSLVFPTGPFFRQGQPSPALPGDTRPQNTLTPTPFHDTRTPKHLP